MKSKYKLSILFMYILVHMCMYVERERREREAGKLCSPLYSDFTLCTCEHGDIFYILCMKTLRYRDIMCFLEV